ncbi:MAG: methyltransferase domain-containing protein [Chloroflexota bacterium]|nr:methyltransferase domain-containing protein [Chloroflexota bacterium]
MRVMVRRIARTVVPASARSLLKSKARQFTAYLAPLDRVIIANKYLRGRGIEIGALHLPLQTPMSAKVSYVDRMSVDQLREHYPELAGEKLVHVDIIDDGEQLATIRDASQDFVIANHFLEHCQNPVLALTNMIRVLKPGKVLYLAVPDKRYTFDVERPVTPIEHVLRDFEDGPAWSKRQHFEEWVRYVLKVEDAAEAEKRVSALLEEDYSIHYHVWTQFELLELVQTLRSKQGLSFDIELFLKNAGECIFVLRKTGDEHSQPRGRP